MCWRSSLAMVTVLTVGGMAAADVPSIPLPGKKFILVIQIIEIGELPPNYALFDVHTSPHTTTLVVTERSVCPGECWSGGCLYAVPRSAVALYPTPQELVKAVDQGRIPGAFRHGRRSWQDEIPDTDRRSSITARYRLERNPSGEGLVLTPIDNPPDRNLEAATALRVQRMVAGVLASLGAALAGLWLARRARRNFASRQPA